MKKLFVILFVAIAATSCKTSLRSASVNNISTEVVSLSAADIQVSNKKVTYTYYVKSDVRRGGFANIKATAISEALKANGGGDVLIECQEATVKRTGLFGTKIVSVTVSGYPATYTNFRNVDPSDYSKVSSVRNNNIKIASQTGLSKIIPLRH